MRTPRFCHVRVDSPDHGQGGVRPPSRAARVGVLAALLACSGTSDAGSTDGCDTSVSATPGCAAFCFGMEPALREMAAGDGGAGWTEEDAAWLDTMCGSVAGVTDCEECFTTVNEGLVSYLSVYLTCGYGFADEEIRKSNGEASEVWSESTYAHMLASCHHSCDSFGLEY